MTSFRTKLSALAGASAICLAGQLPPPASRTMDFDRDVKPLLASRCVSCHGPSTQSNGLRLDTAEGARRGGYAGAVIIPGKSADSKLIRVVAGTESSIAMPPAGPRLTAGEIGILRAWIDQGPVSAAAGPPAEPPPAKGPSHWAYRSIVRPMVPMVRRRGWVRNPIDAFVLARLEKAGVEPSPEADRRTLIRRLSLDLTGLPPAPGDAVRFLDGTAADAWSKGVERLLQSPRYGEKWAMHWLDQARYADSDGFEKDTERPHAWRYRHWMIRALNEDMPFDRFTREQLAGDLLPGASPEELAATGFHRNTLKNREGGVKLEPARFEETVDRANTAGAIWLGLTIGCAQCHDHKFDPITQKDYYRFFALFNGLDEVDVDAPLSGEMGPYLEALPGYLARRRALLDEYKVPQLQPDWEMNMLEAAANPGKRTDWDVSFDVLGLYLSGGEAILRTPAAKRNAEDAYALTLYFIKNYSRVLSSDAYSALRFKELAGKLADLDRAFPSLSKAQAVRDHPNGRTTHIHIRGQADRPGIEVEPGIPEFLTNGLAKPVRTRLELADWLVSPDNPLTARVTVNRIWQEYFGRGLVSTSLDFGAKGEPPSHPELLDWLAREFIESGWSLKHLHRLIVDSAVYRQSSSARPELRDRDPQNRMLARQERLRLPGELIRDNALAVSGLLYEKTGGPSVKPPQPAGVAELAYAGSVKWKESRGADRYRRGLYIHLQRTVPYPFLVNFDMANRNVASCSRERSNTPLQALNLLNDSVFHEAAQALAMRVVRETGPGASLNDRVRRAFLLALSRPPSANELEQMTAFYTKGRAMLSAGDHAAALAPIAVAGTEPAELAAWVGISRILLNLDEFITRE